MSRQGLTLAALAEHAIVAAGDVIDVTATLSADGAEDIELSGSGSGIVFLSFTRLEDGVGSGPPVSTGDCVPHVIHANQPLVVPFQKSGGYSPGDPNAEFMEVYTATPELTLPAGTWRIDVIALGTVGSGCTGELLGHEIALKVRVTD